MSMMRDLRARVRAPLPRDDRPRIAETHRGGRVAARPRVGRRELDLHAAELGDERRERPLGQRPRRRSGRRIDDDVLPARVEQREPPGRVRLARCVERGQRLLADEQRLQHALDLVGRCGYDAGGERQRVRMRCRQDRALSRGR
jgi:hypothetical protein